MAMQFLILGTLLSIIGLIIISFGVFNLSINKNNDAKKDFIQMLFFIGFVVLFLGLSVTFFGFGLKYVGAVIVVFGVCYICSRDI